MPFLETVFLIIGWTILTAMAIAGVAFVGSLIGVAAFISFWIGWIPILAVYSDPDWVVQWTGGNLIEKWALFSSVVYVTIAAGLFASGLIGMLFGDNNLFFKILASIFPHPALKTVRQGTQRSLDKGISGTDLAKDLSKRPFSILGMKLQEHNSKKVTKEMEAEKDWLKGQENIARTAVETEINRTTAKAYDDAIEDRKAAVAEHNARRRELAGLAAQSPQASWALGQIPKGVMPTDDSAEASRPQTYAERRAKAREEADRNPSVQNSSNTAPDEIFDKVWDTAKTQSVPTPRVSRPLGVPPLFKPKKPQSEETDADLWESFIDRNLKDD